MQRYPKNLGVHTYLNYENNTILTYTYLYTNQVVIILLGTWANFTAKLKYYDSYISGEDLQNAYRSTSPAFSFFNS